MGVFNVGDWLYPDISQGRQPQYPCDPTSETLGDGLIGLWNFGVSLLDLSKTGLPWTKTGTSIKARPAGLALDIPAITNTDLLKITSLAAAQTPKEGSVWWYGRGLGNASASDNPPLLAIFYNSSGTSPYLAIGVHRSNATTGLSGFWNNAGTFQSIATSAFVNGEDAQYCLTVKSGSAKLYKNGVVIGSSTSASTISYGSGPCLSVSYNPANTTCGINSATYAAGLWNRALMAPEVASLYAAPWNVVKPPPIDIWAPSAGGATSATIAGTDGPDTAAVVAATWTTAQIAATDGGDVAALATTVTTGAGIAGTDGADNAVIAAANWTTAQIAGADGKDVSGITASVDNSTSASISATDGADAASAYAANWTTALLAAVDGADAAALVAGTAGTTSAGISATDGADIVALGVGATGPLILAGSMRHAASLSSSARLATTLRGSIAHV